MTRSNCFEYPEIVFRERNNTGKREREGKQRGGSFVVSEMEWKEEKKK